LIWGAEKNKPIISFLIFSGNYCQKTLGAQNVSDPNNSVQWIMLPTVSEQSKAQADSMLLNISTMFTTNFYGALFKNNRSQNIIDLKVIDFDLQKSFL
jgi:hypothetical protein